MTRTFDSIPQFELFIYSLPKKYPTIISSTLVFKRLGRSIGEVAGTIQFPHHITLKVHERVDFLDDTIESYSYEVYQKN